MDDKHSNEAETFISSSVLLKSKLITEKSLHLSVRVPPAAGGVLGFLSTKSMILWISCKNEKNNLKVIYKKLNKIGIPKIHQDFLLQQRKWGGAQLYIAHLQQICEVGGGPKPFLPLVTWWDVQTPFSQLSLQKETIHKSV